VAYGYLGTMRTKPGHRDEVVQLLVGGAEALAAIGCRLYLVSVSPDDVDCIWVSEVWETKEAHDDSLKRPEVQAAIARAMPMLTGEFTSQELAVVGGLGADS
jgi:quinol monooxygenase YgiN